MRPYKATNIACPFHTVDCTPRLPDVAVIAADETSCGAAGRYYSATVRRRHGKGPGNLTVFAVPTNEPAEDGASCHAYLSGIGVFNFAVVQVNKTACTTRVSPFHAGVLSAG